jgi:hypothetical protein
MERALSFLDDLSRTLDPFCLELVLDAFAYSLGPSSFRRSFTVQRLVIGASGESAVLSATDERANQISHCGTYSSTMQLLA